MENREILRKRSQERMKELVFECSAKGSQQEFADYCGISKYSLSQYVNGTNSPGNVNAAKIAKKMHVNPLWVMGFDVPKTEIERSEEERQYAQQVNLRLAQEELLRKYCELHGIDIKGGIDKDLKGNFLYITFNNGKQDERKYAITNEDWKIINMNFSKTLELLLVHMDKYPTLLE